MKKLIIPVIFLVGLSNMNSQLGIMTFALLASLPIEPKNISSPTGMDLIHRIKLSPFAQLKAYNVMLLYELL
ncbi:hypothetical protein J2772_000341 [Chryseobacterium jejuense]|nr:hypothetical protein [Chryseobacterium jejuense]